MFGRVLVLSVFLSSGWAFSTTRILVVRSTDDRVLKVGEDERGFAVSEADIRKVARESGGDVRVERVLLEDFESLPIEKQLKGTDPISAIVFQGHGNELEYVPNRSERFRGDQFAEIVKRFLGRLVIPKLAPDVLIYFTGCEMAKNSPGEGFLDSFVETMMKTTYAGVDSLLVMGQIRSTFPNSLTQMSATETLVRPPNYIRRSLQNHPFRDSFMTRLMTLPILTALVYFRARGAELVPLTVAKMGLVGLPIVYWITTHILLKHYSNQRVDRVGVFLDRSMSPDQLIRIEEIVDGNRSSYEGLALPFFAGFARGGSQEARCMAELFQPIRTREAFLREDPKF